MADIREKDLEEVVGGCEERIVFGDIDIRKDLYENIILSSNDNKRVTNEKDEQIIK